MVAILVWSIAVAGVLLFALGGGAWLTRGQVIAWRSDLVEGRYRTLSLIGIWLNGEAMLTVHADTVTDPELVTGWRRQKGDHAWDATWLWLPATSKLYGKRLLFSSSITPTKAGVVYEWSLMPPCWLVVLTGLGMVIPLVLRIRRMRQECTRRMAGLCAVCGYDLRASPERCPECGTPLPKPAQKVPPTT
jgi:hypothetical protein